MTGNDNVTQARSRSIPLADRTAATSSFKRHAATFHLASKVKVNGTAAMAAATRNKWGGVEDVSSAILPNAISFSSPATTWAHMPRNEQKLEKMAKQSLLHELWQEQQRTHGIAVDWFLENMPASYFRQTTEEARLQHLGAIASMLEEQPRDKASGLSSTRMSPTRDVTLHFERSFQDRKEVTFVQPRFKNRDGGLLRVLDSLPRPDGSLQRVHVFPSRDGNLAINVFGYVQQPDIPGDGIPPAETQAKKARRTAVVAEVLAANGSGDHEKVVRGPVSEIVISSSELLEYAASIQAGEWIGDASHPPPDPMFDPDAMLDYISRCEPEFVQHSHPRRFCKHRMLHENATKTGGIAADVEAYQGSETGAKELCGSYWISIAAASVLPKVALGQALRLLASYELDAIRCHLDVVDDPDNGSVTIMRILVNDTKAASAVRDAPEEPVNGWDAGKKWDQPGAWDPVLNDLRRLKWLDDRVYELALDRHSGLGLERSEVIVALANMVYGTLNKQNPWAYSKTQIYQWLDNPRYVKHAAAAADLFCARFDPDSPMEQERAENTAGDIRAAIKLDVEYDVVQGLLIKMVDAVLATYRTNFFMPNRWALSLRINPRVLMTPGELEADSGTEVPFGVFFISGRRFNGFHCRFRDIARGGMRIVTPQTPEQVAIEAGRQFDECYALAYAQQLKNKDIPEGGSKAVVLVDTLNSTGRAKDYAVRKGVKAFSDALLDLVIDTDETRRYVVDRWGKPELLYLGPDEQVIPQDINWIVARATHRGAPFPLAFMSSKPDTGINHKEFGVTSEGIFVFLDEALRDAGINPKSGQKFTVKLTGGPDGDVAGNMIKILDREYGEACLIVGVADGTGSAEDPEGLCHEELLRLFYDGLPITEYRLIKSSPRGVVHTCDKEEGIRARNTMHNRVKADAFVPAGGRPGTINGANWSSFLDDDGRPSSPLVVEGANLFTTPEARDLLFKEAGVVFVKDSSANKCGVICSSFEIVSSMLMTSEEFTDNKTEIVSQVLDLLRAVGRREAELLFREHRNHPTTPLPRISERISHAINSVTDAALKILDDTTRDEHEEHTRLLLPLFRKHLPDKLVELAFDRVLTTLPPQYLRNAMATCLACKVVYTEGINFIDAQPHARLGELAFEYIREDGVIRSLTEVVEGSADRAMSEEERGKIAHILRSAGVRASLGVY